MSALQVEPLAQQAIALRLPASLGQCQIVSWHVDEGEWAWHGKPMLTVKAGEQERTISAPADGTVTSISAFPGEQVARGASVGCFAPEPARRATSPVLAAKPHQPISAPPETQSAPNSAALEASAEAPPTPTAEPARSKRKQERTRTKHATWHVTGGQQERLKKTVARLTLADVSTNESELVRTALEMLLSLPDPALMALISENKERERAGKYGVGWPKPGRGREK